MPNSNSDQLNRNLQGSDIKNIYLYGRVIDAVQGWKPGTTGLKNHPKSLTMQTCGPSWKLTQEWSGPQESEAVTVTQSLANKRIKWVQEVTPVLQLTLESWVAQAAVLGKALRWLRLWCPLQLKTTAQAPAAVPRTRQLSQKQWIPLCSAQLHRLPCHSGTHQDFKPSGDTGASSAHLPPPHSRPSHTDFLAVP